MSTYTDYWSYKSVITKFNIESNGNLIPKGFVGTTSFGDVEIDVTFTLSCGARVLMRNVSTNDIELYDPSAPIDFGEN